MADNDKKADSPTEVVVKKGVAIKPINTLSFPLSRSGVSIPKEMYEEKYSVIERTCPIALPMVNGATIEQTQSGVIAIIGVTGSGKSTIAKLGILPGFKSMLPEGSVQVINFLEEVQYPERAVTLESELYQQLTTFLNDSTKKVLIIDSLRHFFYTGKGATGKGGVNMSMFTDLSALDNIANVYGKTIIALINPNEVDEETYNSMVHSLAASVKGTIAIKWSKSYLTSEGMERSYRFSFRGSRNRSFANASVDLTTLFNNSASVSTIEYSVPNQESDIVIVSGKESIEQAEDIVDEALDVKQILNRNL